MPNRLPLVIARRLQVRGSNGLLPSPLAKQDLSFLFRTRAPRRRHPTARSNIVLARAGDPRRTQHVFHTKVILLVGRIIYGRFTGCFCLGWHTELLRSRWSDRFVCYGMSPCFADVYQWRDLKEALNIHSVQAKFSFVLVPLLCMLGAREPKQFHKIMLAYPEFR